MIAGLTVADLARPSERRIVRFYDAALIVGGSVVIAVCAQIAIGYPVPITGQTFAVLMVAALLGARRGALCILTYLAEGLLGLPVRYHGGSAPCRHPVLERWLAEGRVIAVCPEVDGGMPVPRPPAEIREARGGRGVLQGAARVVEAKGPVASTSPETLLQAETFKLLSNSTW